MGCARMGLIKELEADRQPAPEAMSFDIQDMRTELALGLSESQAEISPKYFYNPLGSKLFEAICQLDEYYLTRCEAGIFEAHKSEIAGVAGREVTLIDLGAGNCAKAANLFAALRPQQYVPVDISAKFLEEAVAALQAEHPEIPMFPVAMDFSAGLQLPPQVRRERRLFFYPGSSLGNFAPAEALRFLQGVRQASGDAGDGLLIGIDLVKDTARLEAAYDDALGVTAAFNRNILLHVNGILGTDFNLRDWGHRALFNDEQSRIEMHLQALRDVTVRWEGGSRSFAAGQSIHTENSYKYTKKRFLELLSEAGFGAASCWTDARNSFLVCYAKAV
jgi:dimethylhistidine N-methyltransferase